MTRKRLDEISRERLISELGEARARLEEASSRYSDLYELAPVGYCTLDPDGRILEINQAGAELLGGPPDRMAGRMFTAVAPFREKGPFLAHLRRCEQESARVLGEVVLAPGAPGVARTLRLISDPIRDEQGETTAYRTVLVDISDLKARESQLRLLSEVGARLVSSLDQAALLDAAAESMVPALADLCMIDLKSESGGVIERPVVRFADPRKHEAFGERIQRATSRPNWASPQAQVIASGEPLLVSELAAAQRERVARDPQVQSALTAAGVRSVMVVPVIARSRTLGALTLASVESGRRYGADDLRLALELAGRMAVALDNARLYRQTQRMNEELLAGAKTAGIVAVSADAIISVDQEQRITLWNDGAEEIYGYSTSEAINAPLEMLIPERFRAANRRAVERFAAGPRVARRLGQRGVKLFGLRKSGEEFPVDTVISKLEVGGETVLTVSVRDISEQTRSEAEQRFLADTGKVLATGLDYRHTLEGVVKLVARDLADVAVLYLLGEDGKIRRAAAASHDPATHRGALPRTDVVVGPEHLAAKVIANKPSVLSEVTPSILASLADGEEHLRALEAANLRSLMGVPLLAGDRCFGALFFESASRLYGAADLWLAEEVGRRMGLLIENARLHGAAQSAIQARDQVLAVVAHDLRNPLSVIVMEAKLLGTEVLASPELSRQAIELIARSAARIDRLIRDLLDAARLDSGALSVEPAPVDVTEVISELVQSQQPLAESSSFELWMEVEHDLGKVFADRSRLLQALENLVGNAAKFTEAGGRITIGAAAGNGEVLFWVADTGAGIPEDELKHLFDRPWQARKPSREGEGTGLGLRIVKGIVDAHHGRLWAESRVGSGSKFSFTMPRPAEVPAGRNGDGQPPGLR